MSNLGLVLNIARTALAAQRYGMDVTAHNIANVNTAGYSRQTPVYAAKQPSLYGGLVMGRGVEIEGALRASDQFIENQLMEQNASMVSAREMETFMGILEALFSETEEAGIHAMLVAFWNYWQDLANNPSGASERAVLHEHSLQLSGQFNGLESQLRQTETELTRSVRTAVGTINELTAQIAQLNGRIVETEVRGRANDLRDERTRILSQLHEILQVKAFEQEDGSLTLVTARGCVLVHGNSSYDLELGGANEDRVLWRSSGGTTTDITDHIREGRLGGYLEMRDEILTKYRLDLDALVSGLIWAVNRQHSQGVGLKLFGPGTALTGTYQTATNLGDLYYGARIGFVANAFTLWIEDRTNPGSPVMNAVSIDLSGLDATSTLADLAAAINGQISAAGLGGVTVDGSGSALRISAAADYAFGFSQDNSQILAALGINTFFQGEGAGSIGVNGVLTDKAYIGAAQIDATGTYAAGDNRNALAMANLQYQNVDLVQWTCDRINGNTQSPVQTTLEDYYQTMLGSMGITSASISRAVAFKEAMVTQLNEIRDSISAVSLDEEMTNLIKFQHAYTAAAKLISASDEMLETLLGIR